jgi:hypothetical protein
MGRKKLKPDVPIILISVETGEEKATLSISSYIGVKVEESLRVGKLI